MDFISHLLLDLKKKKKTLFFKLFGFAPFAIYYMMVLDLDLMVGSYNATFLL